jgi:hypothetical protein
MSNSKIVESWEAYAPDDRLKPALAAVALNQLDREREEQNRRRYKNKWIFWSSISLVIALLVWRPIVFLISCLFSIPADFFVAFVYPICWLLGIDAAWMYNSWATGWLTAGVIISVITHLILIILGVQLAIIIYSKINYVRR